VQPPDPKRRDGGPPAEQVLPPPIRSVLLGGAVEADHRLVTVGFVQYSGTDRLLQSSGPVALADALDDVVRNVQHACADFDVTFFETDINRDGGKIMLTAGAPLSADHDEERMLRVARQVIDRAGRLPLRIGINRGHVFSGDFGPKFRRTYSVKGDAINLAARVMAKALPGQVLATMEVVSHSQTVFRTSELPPFVVKGKSQPVRAADVGQLLGARAEAQPSAPMAGRSAESAALQRVIAEAAAGHGQYVEVVGEAGTGKSRLVGEGLASRSEMRVVKVQCEEYEASTPYFPFRQLLRDVLMIPNDAPAEQVAELLTNVLRATAPRLLPWLPLLGVPMDVHLPPTRETSELDERFRRARVQEVVSDLLRAVVRVPTALVIHDAHFMDDASTDLVRSLGEGLTGHPLLVVVSRREGPTFLASTSGTAVTTITLKPLDHASSLELVQALAGDHPLPPQVASDVVARAGGNPMFLQALVVEAGRAGGADLLPESVEALVTSQIDRLDPADRTVVRYAAVFGTVVDERALDLLLEQHDVQLPAGTMQRLGDFLDRDRSGHLRFRNELIRDVAYEALPFSRRKALHDHVAQAIESASDSPENQSELLSLHFFHAGRYDQAWRYSVVAGSRALAKYAHGEAIRFFARAAQSATHRIGVDDHELARVYEMLADSRWFAGLTQEAAEAYASARACLRGDPVGVAGIIEKEARVDQRHRKHSLAMRRISTGFNRLKDVPGPRAAIARSLLARRYAHSKFNQGRVSDALRWADIAAYEAEEAVDKDALAAAYEMLNFVYASSEQEEPLPYGKIALQAYVELGDLPGQGHCLNNLAMQDYSQGRWDESLTHLRRASDIFHRIGDTAAEANALYNQAELLVRQRRPADAEVVLPDVLRIARAVEDEELVALAVREQARAAALTGHLTRASALLKEARAMFTDLEEPDEVRSTDLVRAEVLLSAGSAGEAGRVLDSAIDPSAPPEPTVSRLIGRQRLAEGRLAEAKEVLEAGLAVAEHDSNRYEEGLLLLALAAHAKREGSPAGLFTRRAGEMLDAMGVRMSLDEDEQSRHGATGTTAGTVPRQRG
jgi:class 3 adenylate cyclase/tetratricopeptide (TPR) repeat protein